MGSPRATAAFLLITGILFAVLLVTLSFRATTEGFAAWLLGAALVVAAGVVVLAVVFSRQVGEGRL